MSHDRPCVDVVAGVLYNHGGQFLLSSRPAGKPYAGYWEFAGGKVEPGESRLAALQREFHEELGIDIAHATPWLTKIHDYEHARVRLHFYRIAAAHWQGELQAREGQHWCWQDAGNPSVSPMLPANSPILAALAIPAYLAGSLQNGFTGQNNRQPYHIVPWQQAEPGHAHLLFAADDMHHRRRFDRPVYTFACVNRPQQWHTVQDADAVIWQLESAADTHNLLAVLQHGSALPLLALADAGLLAEHGAPLLTAGAHGLIENTMPALA